MIDRIELFSTEWDNPQERHERADAAANRALILHTAERLFAERGVANVNMADIAEAAGVGKGTLYRRFANKGELCLSLMDQQMSEFQNGMLERFHVWTVSGIPYLEQLARFLEALVDFTELHSPLLLEVAHGELVHTRLNLPHYWQYMTVSALLRSAHSRGEIAGDIDLDFFGEALLAQLQVDYFQFQRRARDYATTRIAAGLRSLVMLIAG
jgi:AcrR family transcriptional regulator